VSFVMDKIIGMTL